MLASSLEIWVKCSQILERSLPTGHSFHRETADSWNLERTEESDFQWYFDEGFSSERANDKKCEVGRRWEREADKEEEEEEKEKEKEEVEEEEEA